MRMSLIERDLFDGATEGDWEAFCWHPVSSRIFFHDSD